MPHDAGRSRSVGEIRVLQQRFAEAIPLLETSLALSQSVGDTMASGAARLLLARALVLVGSRRDRHRAIELAMRAEQDFTATGNEARLKEVREWLALHSRS